MKYTMKEYKKLTQYVKKGGIERKIVYSPVPLYEQTVNTEENVFFSENVAQTFVRIQLKKLANLGNVGAIRIVNNYFHDDIVEDLKQEVLITIWNNMDKLITPADYLTENEQYVKDFRTFGFSFIDYESTKIKVSKTIDGKKIEYFKNVMISSTKQKIYGAVSNYLYKIANKYNNREELFVELYNGRTNKIEMQAYRNYERTEEFKFNPFILRDFLTERQYEVVFLKTEGMDFTKISQILKTSPQNVSQIYNKAINKLQKNEQSILNRLNGIEISINHEWVKK